MIIDKKHFYDTYRDLFGVIKDQEFEALEFLLAKFDASEIFNTKAKIAYALATIEKETAYTFRPVVEGYYMSGNRLGKLYNYYREQNPGALSTIFPNGAKEPAYYGRGFTQITHNFNYNKFSNLFKVDLLNRPNEALDPSLAFSIIEYGMEHGSFTGKKLSDYFGEGKIVRFGKWKKANGGWDSPRKMINGIDAADEIGRSAEKFMECINFIEAPAESINGEDREVNPEPKPAEQ
jgi:hypothetical protein